MPWSSCQFGHLVILVVVMCIGGVFSSSLRFLSLSCGGGRVCTNLSSILTRNMCGTILNKETQRPNAQLYAMSHLIRKLAPCRSALGRLRASNPSRHHHPIAHLTTGPLSELAFDTTREVS
jgi:hypothetical protein